MQRRTYIGLATLALTSACGFEISGGSSTPDDAMNGSDGSSGSDSLSAACPWPYVPEYAMPCPATDGPAITITDGKHTLNTDDGTLTDALSSTPIESEIAGDIRIVWTRGLHIGTDATIRVVGSFPLVIIATGSITIDGELDGAGHRRTTALDPTAPGADPPECSDMNTGQETGAGPGQPCANEGASGGGGGSFAAIGGQGGGGGETHSCGAFPGAAPGGTPGVAVLSRPLNLRGGCPGAIGGLSTQAGSIAGLPGTGGGAIALVAHDSIAINGKVNVGGAGGGGSTKRGGGGGGGSGGMIVLEGSTVTITSDGHVSANGGGGGGGSDPGTGDNGQDGEDSVDAADGGQKNGAGTDGGKGGARDDAARAAQISDRGGGGGGGGVGFVRIHSALGAASAPDDGVSPMPSP